MSKGAISVEKQISVLNATIARLNAQLEAMPCYFAWILDNMESTCISDDAILKKCPVCIAAIKGEGDE